MTFGHPVGTFDPATAASTSPIKLRSLRTKGWVMTDHERVLVGLFSAGDRDWAGDVGLLEIVEMLYKLGAEHSAQVHGDRTLVNA